MYIPSRINSLLKLCGVFSFTYLKYVKSKKKNQINLIKYCVQYLTGFSSI